MATEACHSNREGTTDSLLNSAHTKAEVPSCSQSMALHSGNARLGHFHLMQDPHNGQRFFQNSPSPCLGSQLCPAVWGSSYPTSLPSLSFYRCQPCMAVRRLPSPTCQPPFSYCTTLYRCFLSVFFPNLILLGICLSEVPNWHSHPLFPADIPSPILTFGYVCI